METFEFRIAFFCLFALGVATEWALHVLNRQEILKHRTCPPSLSKLEGLFDPENFAKSQAYSLKHMAFSIFFLLVSAALTIITLYSGVLLGLDQVLNHFVGDGLTHSVLFLSTILAAQTLFKIPFSCYSTFRIEGAFGFNTMTWKLFWRDTFMQLLLVSAIGVPLLYAFFFFIAKAGADWWLWAFALIVSFQVIAMGIYPVFIAPLFNRFHPLPEGELKTALLSMAQRLQFPAADIHVMNGSLRSLHANAYFMGIGKWRRIVLFDTLLRQMENQELLSVVAHEIGHYKHAHIYKQICLQTLMLGALLYLASLVLHFQPLVGAFGFASQVGPAPRVFLFLTCLSSVSIWMMPIQNFISRRFEYAADAYAVKACRGTESMSRALTKLAAKNLSNLTPHPWYSTFYYSHPILENRLKAMEIPVL